MIKVHGVSPSPFVRKVLTCLELKGIAYERINVMPIGTPEDFIHISPLRKIPAMEDGDFSLSDSSVICEYLDDAYPQTATRPQDLKQRAHARWLEEYADTKLQSLIGTVFYERALKTVFLKQEANEALIEEIINDKLPSALDYLESQLPESGFLFGESLMVADIAIGSPFINAAYAGFIPDAERWPKLTRFIETLKAHPVLQKRLAEEAELMASIS